MGDGAPRCAVRLVLPLDDLLLSAGTFEVLCQRPIAAVDDCGIHFLSSVITVKSHSYNVSHGDSLTRYLPFKKINVELTTVVCAGSAQRMARKNSVHCCRRRVCVDRGIGSTASVCGQIPR